MDDLAERSSVTQVDAPPPASARRPRIVIIGAGFGGLSAAQRLARVAADIIVIDRRNHHLFQPLLYQVATAALSPADIAAPVRGILSKSKNMAVIRHFALNLVRQVADKQSIKQRRKRASWDPKYLLEILGPRRC